MTRREFAAIGAAAFAFPNIVSASDSVDTHKRRAIRLAHLTDIHVQPQLKADEGMAACLRHLQEHKDAPELILFGGDCIMDAFAATKSRTAQEWDVWQRVLKAECSLPFEACIGNHDIWGGNKFLSGTRGNEPEYGKNWAIDVLELPKRYRSFDRAGWHFVALDSVQPEGLSYKAYLDDEQFDWLERDLAAVPDTTPVLVFSHIPIISAAAYFDGDNTRDSKWEVGASLMHIDARKIKDLFAKHPNVQLCLSGHLHLNDRVDYAGVSYFCNGAVCGGWWQGDHQECDEGYALVDLYDDGSFDCQYVPYGWKPRKS